MRWPLVVIAKVNKSLFLSDMYTIYQHFFQKFATKVIECILSIKRKREKRTREQETEKENMI